MIRYVNNTFRHTYNENTENENRIILKNTPTKQPASHSEQSVSATPCYIAILVVTERLRGIVLHDECMIWYVFTSTAGDSSPGS